MTARVGKYLHVVFTNPTEGSEDEFNEWYSTVHLPEVLEMPGFVSGQRFKLLDPEHLDGPRYLAVYEIESDDIDATIQMIPRLAPHRIKSPAIDTAVSDVRTYEPIGERLVARPDTPTLESNRTPTRSTQS
jgi:hypothetical protein